MTRAVRVRITGLVQGVGYRDWTQREAHSRGLDGWVRNRRDGSVEAVLSGPAEAVAGMLEACRSGPRSAEVEAVESEAWNVPIAEGFSVKPTF